MRPTLDCDQNSTRGEGSVVTFSQEEGVTTSISLSPEVSVDTAIEYSADDSSEFDPLKYKSSRSADSSPTLQITSKFRSLNLKSTSLDYSISSPPKRSISAQELDQLALRYPSRINLPNFVTPNVRHSSQSNRVSHISDLAIPPPAVPDVSRHENTSTARLVSLPDRNIVADATSDPGASHYYSNTAAAALSKLRLTQHQFFQQQQEEWPLQKQIQHLQLQQQLQQQQQQSTADPPTVMNQLSSLALNSAICKYFLNGNCVRGDQCNYAHITATKGTGMVGARGAKNDNNNILASSLYENKTIKRNDYNLTTEGLSTLGGMSSIHSSSADQLYSLAGNNNSVFLPKSRSSSSLPISEDNNDSFGSGFPIHLRDFASKIPAQPITARDITTQVYMLAKDQHGCRLLQRMLEDRELLTFEVIFTEVFRRINELMTDPFGNYLCQKLMDFADDQQRLKILHKVAHDLVAISLNIHGTRVIQKILEVMSTIAEVEMVVRSLRSSVVTLTKDLNGNHVIQRCLHHMRHSHNQFIYDSISMHCVSVATHKHGCCVLQRCIDYATEQQRMQLMSEIVDNALELVQDSFGNYVVQYVLDLENRRVSRVLMTKLLGSISNLAVQKFSSNVIEKCLAIADEDIKIRIIDELVDPQRLPRLLQDPYANYVIQKALSVSKQERDRFDYLIELIRPHVHALRTTSFGKRIQSKIVKRFPILAVDDVLLEDRHRVNVF